MRRAIGIAAYTTGVLTGITYMRFMGLREAAERALRRGNVKETKRLATELLELAERYKGDWNQGNAVHHGNTILGLCALCADSVAEAEQSLLAAGRCPGSPQLKSFGPNMRLAAELLKAGRPAVVLEYLELCKTFWTVEVKTGEGKTFAGSKQLDKWAAAIREGRVPDFDPNMVY